MNATAETAALTESLRNLGLVARDELARDELVRANLVDAVDEQERIPVGKDPLDGPDVEHGAYFLADGAGGLAEGAAGLPPPPSAPDRKSVV